jgi:hypothetical protein
MSSATALDALGAAAMAMGDRFGLQGSSPWARITVLTRGRLLAPSRPADPSEPFGPLGGFAREFPVLTAPCLSRWRDSPALGLTAVPSGRRALSEQVPHRAWLAAEEAAEERVGAGEASLAGSLVEAEQEPRHGLRGALRDLPGHPLLVV